MTPGDILWFFFMLSALQPVLKQRFLEAARQRLIARIESQRDSRVILLVHRQETMSFLGFPVLRYIDVNDSEEVLRAIHLTDPNVPLDSVLHTPGGLVLASLQIARAIHKHKGKVTAFVPHYAMSGGTLIALAANEIVMSEYAVLGPVDPQLGQNPGASILKAVERKPIAEVDDQTLIMADQAEKAIAQVRESVRELLADKIPQEKLEELTTSAPGNLDTRPSHYLRGGHEFRPSGPEQYSGRVSGFDEPLSATGPAPADSGVPANTAPPQRCSATIGVTHHGECGI